MSHCHGNKISGSQQTMVLKIWWKKQNNWHAWLSILRTIALRNKGVAHTFLSSFNNANGCLCQDSLLRYRNFATMVTWCHISPLYMGKNITKNRFQKSQMDKNISEHKINKPGRLSVSPSPNPAGPPDCCTTLALECTDWIFLLPSCELGRSSVLFAVRNIWETLWSILQVNQ